MASFNQDPGRFVFDWREFHNHLTEASRHWLYIASKARRGDLQAAELLQGMTITDANGVVYWPISEEEKKADMEQAFIGGPMGNFIIGLIPPADTPVIQEGK